MNRFPPRLYLLAPLCAVFLCAACTPTYDWREVHGSSIPFTVVLPAKPSTFARPVNLDGMQVTMTMTAAKAGDATFAVATAEMANPAEAQAALKKMETALVRNIKGAVRKEQATSSAEISTLAVEAAGPQHTMSARFVARGTRVYQVLALGKRDELQPEAVDTFLTSFKPE